MGFLMVLPPGDQPVPTLCLWGCTGKSITSPVPCPLIRVTLSVSSPDPHWLGPTLRGWVWQSAPCVSMVTCRHLSWAPAQEGVQGTKQDPVWWVNWKDGGWCYSMNQADSGHRDCPPSRRPFPSSEGRGSVSPWTGALKAAGGRGHWR